MNAIPWLSPDKLRYLFYFILATLVAQFLSTLFIFYMDLRLSSYLPSVEADVLSSHPKRTEQHPLEYYKGILDRNLFGAKTEETEKKTQRDLRDQIDQLALTSMNFTLVGTILNEGGVSWAVIMDNQNNREDRYTVGSVIKGAKVVMILRNKVVLNIDGKDELLVMGIEKIRADEKTSEKGGAGSGEVVAYTINKEVIQKSVSNIGDIMTQLRVKPYFHEGKPSGFLISNIKNGSVVDSLGFKDGDIIKGVNGEEIRSVEDIMRLYGTIKDSSFFSVGIVRGNENKTLNFKVK